MKFADIRNFRVSERYDAAICLYNVLCDLNGLADLDRVFATVAKSIKKNSLFIFDCLYGPAILKNRPEKKVKEIVFGKKTFIQTRITRLNIKESITDTLFEVFEVIKGGKQKITQKRHNVRFWYFTELEYLLHKNGFKIIKTGNAMDFSEDISEDNWDMFVVAKKI